MQSDCQLIPVTPINRMGEFPVTLLSSLKVFYITICPAEGYLTIHCFPAPSPFVSDWK